MNINKRGISLITLAVTISVTIILLLVVILTINKNNPVDLAKDARFKEDVSIFRDDLNMTISKDYVAYSGNRDKKITAYEFNSIKDSIPSFTKKYDGKFAIINDELRFVEDNLSENEYYCLKEMGMLPSSTTSERIENNINEFYGKKVVNYSSNGVSDWKIFNSNDKGIFLISSEYVSINSLPKKNGATISNTQSSYPKAGPFNNVVGQYSGTANITDERIKALNNDYFKKSYTSENYNMKAVAYMLDIGIWNIFAEGIGAEYAIGGPTLEMLFESYNKTHPNKNYLAQAVGPEGYKISKDGGNTYVTWSEGMLDKGNRLYVLPSTNKTLESGNKSGANSTWLATPSAHNVEYVMDIGYNEDVNASKYTNPYLGFRPVVCLNSNITLIKVKEGYKIIE